MSVPSSHRSPRVQAKTMVTRMRRLGWLVFAFALILHGQPALAFQDGQLAPSISIDEVEETQRARFESYLEAGQWNDALNAMDGLVEQSGQRWTKIAESTSPSGSYDTYISGRSFVDLTLAFGPKELLEKYRQRVDPIAERWWNDTGTPHIEKTRQIVESMPLCSRGDEAMLALADEFLERGELHRARELLERLVPNARLAVDAAVNFPSIPGGASWIHWEQHANAGTLDQIDLVANESNNVGIAVFPDSDVPVVDIWARLIWISIAERDFRRARAELEMFDRSFSSAEGTLHGESGTWTSLLRAQLSVGERLVPPPRQESGWTQFSGSLSRAKTSAFPLDLEGAPAWSVEVPRIDISEEPQFGHLTRLVDAPTAAIPYFPLVIDDKVIWCERNQIRVVRLMDGTPYWPLDDETDSDKRTSGQVVVIDEQIEPVGNERRMARIPRFTMSSGSGRVVARLGSPLTASPNEEFHDSAQIWGLNFEPTVSIAPGFPIRPLEAFAEFDGCPIVVGNFLYALLRKTSPDSARVSVTLACFEQVTVTPTREARPVWTMELCESEMPTIREWDLTSHNVLSYSEGILYVNTNAGVVAAVDAVEGRPLWLTTYPRAAWQPSGENLHFQRDLTPCVIQDDHVIVAPNDSRDVFALDRTTGRMIWQLELPDAQYVLGLTEDHVIFGGGQLFWVDRWNGLLQTSFPRSTLAAANNAAKLSPRGFGRGTMSSNHVYWTSHDQLFVFDVQPEKSIGLDGRTWYSPKATQVFELSPRGVTGGNLILTGSMLLIAGPDRIWAFPQNQSLDPK